MTMLLPLCEFSFEFCAFCPRFNTITVLQIFSKLSLVRGSLALVAVGAEAVRHIAAPLSD
eukprot:CAMPEP_0169383508 /NCGR_PEP_ID=MMETSP1017-20121227/42784_1 /TAXON_ID=342587 /ORGANISM="Karlodinium micrum, Strain CCMP2283" /LENGTH=59 /DNA_ID=CAMNT_0009483709 /DNA_START=353 /DNA_END=529 /DNA_ORIENTATION=+